MTTEKVNILGIGIDAVNTATALRRIDAKIKGCGKGYVTLTGAHGIMASQRSERIQAAHRNAWMVLPDGMPLVYLGRLGGHRKMRRCFGPDFMTALLNASIPKRYTHFLFGGKPGVALELKGKIEKKHPGVRIVGTYTPPFRPLNRQEREELLELVASSRPDIFWVGLSTPKQELFMQEYLPLLSTRIMLGVGAAFDYHRGQLKPAPKLIQTLSLEWFFRLLMEPRRLWKRYLVNHPAFLFHILLQMTGVRNYPLSE